MKLLLEMGVSPHIAETLRHAGHDVLHIAEQRLFRMPDEEIVRKAEAEQRTLVTFDLDFGHIMALQRFARPSIILIRADQFTTDEVGRRLVTAIDEYADDLRSGAILVLDPDRIRIRSLPIW